MQDGFRERHGGRAVRAALVAAAVSTGPSFAAPPQGPPPVQIIPPVETELLRLEVVVLDERGRPVSGLAIGDFQVAEDGKEQAVTHFQPAAPGLADPAAALRAAEEEEPEPAGPPPEGRHIVLAIDDLHLSPNSLAGSKIALKRFVGERLSEEDEVAIVTTSGSLGLYQAFTRERLVLRRAIDRLAYRERRGNAGGRANMSEQQAEAIDRGDPDALALATGDITLRDYLSAQAPTGIVNPRIAFEAKGMARGILNQALETTNLTLSALDRVVRSLSFVPGRKLLVLVSDGFLMGQGTQDARTFDLRRVFDASARAGVSIYALHGAGLSAEPSTGDASRQADPEQSAPAIRDRYRRLGDIVQRDSLSAVAQGTGGFLVHGGNDLLGGLAHILRDSDSAYLLAYSPTNPARDGRFRTIAVRLPAHPRYEVRTRRGYYARTDRTPPAPAVASAAVRRDEELQTALASLVPLRGVPIRLAADYVDVPAEGPRLVIRAHVDLHNVPFRRTLDRHQADLEIVGVVYDDSGEIVGDMEGERAELSLTTASYRQLLREGLGYRRSLALPPGLYQVRLVARESLSSQVGTAVQWVQIPDLGRGTLTLSSVFLFSERGGGPPRDVRSVDQLTDVQARKTFERGGRLFYSVYVYNPSRDDGGTTDVVLQAQVWAGGKLQGASPAEPVAFAREAAPMTGQVTLEGLAAGDYELRVLVVDRKQNAKALRRVTFTVT